MQKSKARKENEENLSHSWNTCAVQNGLPQARPQQTRRMDDPQVAAPMDLHVAKATCQNKSSFSSLLCTVKFGMSGGCYLL